MSAELFLISAGAAKGLVAAIEPGWNERTAISVRGDFGAVGAMKQKLLDGAPCDVLILTQAMLEDLGRSGAIDPGTIRPLGRVYTGVAVPVAAALPRIDDTAMLANALRAASAIYFPDPERATAGIHFANVLRSLGIADLLAPRLRTFPNGASAMRALADAGDADAIGCTQVTEIRYTHGVTLVGMLPAPFELATLYSIAVTGRARDRRNAQRFVEALTEAQAEPVRRRGGFEPVG